MDGRCSCSVKFKMRLMGPFIHGKRLVCSARFYRCVRCATTYMLLSCFLYACEGNPNEQKLPYRIPDTDTSVISYMDAPSDDINSKLLEDAKVLAEENVIYRDTGDTVMEAAIVDEDVYIEDAHIEAKDTGPKVVLEECGYDIEYLFSKSAIDPPGSGSGVFNAAEEAQQKSLNRSIRSIIDGDISNGIAAAVEASYDVCTADGSSPRVVVWRPQVSGQGHAVIAWRVEDATPLIIEVPHAWHDVDTEIEALEMFIELNARVLIFTGTYRCASLAPSSCDGVTTACIGLPIPYPKSDAAHNDNMFFHAAHVALSESFTTATIVSVHGFLDNGISISNGTDSSPTADSFHIKLVNALVRVFPEEKITSCQQYPGAPYERRMCGSENVQGRHINGSANACTQTAESSSDRFIHIEQSLAVRSQRDLVLQAFGEAL